VRISVSDTGSGIPEDIQTKIFEPFFTTKPVGKGTGLGLSTVFSLVKSHDGFLELKSKVGHGATFDIFFPAQVRAPEILAPRPLQQLTEAAGKRLLIVDDEVGLLAIVKNMLETLGYSVVTATGGLEALAAIENTSQPFDLVLTDWSMPVMSGGELIRKIRQTKPDSKILVFTGSAIREDTAELKVAGYLRKPYTTETLIGAIDAALSSDRLENQLCAPGNAG
jgi:CheY-like chemotaxis protein